MRTARSEVGDENGTMIRKLALHGLAAIALAGAAPAGADPGPVAFVNVNVVSMATGGVTPARTVIVDAGRIATIGPVEQTPVPKAAEIVDGTDRYLMPGLGEMHAHVPPAGSPELERVLTLFAANGVTVIRGMLGHPSHLELRERLARGAVFGPRLVTSGPSLNGNSVAGPADAEQQVREQAAAGYDFIKVHPGLSRPEFDAIARTAGELGMPFAGHVPADVGLRNALDAGMTTIDHLDGYLAAMVPADADPSGGIGGFFGVLLAGELRMELVPELARRTAAAGTLNVPTESLFEHRVGPVPAADLAARAEMRFMPENVVSRWVAITERQRRERGFDAAIAAKAIDARRRLILALHEAGAGLLLGSDAPQVFNVPGFSAHHELAFLVAAGLSPEAALAAGTSSVASFLGTNTGLVVEGRDADLVLLDANPLEDIANSRRIHGVMLRGAWYDRAALNARLEALAGGPARM